MKPTSSAPNAQTPSNLPEWYEQQYNNRLRVPLALQHLTDWAERSRAAREAAAGPGGAPGGVQLDVRYGSGAAEVLDIFGARPRGTRAPALVHIHGGYWRALSKSDQSFVAPPFVRAGAVVVVPDYALAPSVSVEHICLQMARAVAWVWRHADELGVDRSRIVVSGHSAGGHLAGMLSACLWPQLEPGLPAGLLHGAVSLSGLFDMEPLRHAPFLAPDLKLTEASARRLSPAFMPAPTHGRLLALVGALESEEFHRQNALIRSAWGKRRVPVCEAVPGCDHFTVLHELADPASRTHRLTLELLGL